MKMPGAAARLLVGLRGRTMRSVATLLAGAAAGQLITLITVPLLTRIFSPEVFGEAGTLLAVASVVMPVAGLCLPLAIVLATDDDEARALGTLSLAISAVLAAVITLGMAFWAALADAPWGMSNRLLMSIPLLMCVGTAVSVLEQWAHRRSCYAASAKVSVGKSLIGNGGKVFGGLMAPVSMTLVLMTAVAEAVAAMLYLGWLRGSVTPDRTTPSRWWVLILKYRQFPLFRAPQVLVSCLSLAVPVLLLGVWYEPAIVGFFVLARSVVAAPSMLLGKAIGDVIYPRLARAAHDGLPLLPLQFKAVTLLGVVGLLPLIPILLAAPLIFGLLFGEAWQMAGEHARWMALWFYFTLVGVPCISSMPILQTQRLHLIYTCFTALIRAALMYWACAIAQLDAITSVALYCVSGAVLNAALMMWVLLLSAHRDRITA
ncbi:lipopolysaccharide biosynthesis protein [Halopseudomonas sp.]|jgi:O-antigen/teichoic acid export membrane protein|uniref:lipopolysaccharide biosynthesis protein n=1 Tax=Halopseudomonas sp. TaxID=2901191 RepID=UPI0039E44314